MPKFMPTSPQQWSVALLGSFSAMIYMVVFIASPRFTLLATIGFSLFVMIMVVLIAIMGLPKVQWSRFTGTAPLSLLAMFVASPVDDMLLLLLGGGSILSIDWLVVLAFGLVTEVSFGMIHPLISVENPIAILLGGGSIQGGRMVSFVKMGLCDGRIAGLQGSSWMMLILAVIVGIYG